jgi:hypothetical protein
MNRRGASFSNRLVILAREQGVSLSPQFIAVFERCYNAIHTEGFAFHDAQPALISTARRIEAGNYNLDFEMRSGAYDKNWQSILPSDIPEGLFRMATDEAKIADFSRLAKSGRGLIVTGVG